MASPRSTPAADSGELRYLTRRRCPRCSHIECTAVCSACGAFKFPRSVRPLDEPPPSATPTDAEITEREAVRLALRFALARWDARAAARAA